MVAVSLVTPAGLALACLSMLGNGTFGIFKNFCKEEPDPVIFGACTALGVCLSSLASLPFFPTDSGGSRPLGWTWEGALGGVLLVMALLNSFIAISLSGISTAQATWSCAAIVVSVLWGVLGPKRGGAGPGAAIGDGCMTGLSVMLLIAGVLVINTKKHVARWGRRRGAEEHRGAGRVAPARELGSGVTSSEGGKESGCETPCKAGAEAAAAEEGRAVQDRGSTPAAQQDERPGAPGRGHILVGLVPALLVGVSGGSILVPMAYVEDRLQGLPGLLSFGPAGAFAGVATAVAYWRLYRGEPFSLAEGSALRAALRPDVILWGVASGVVWNLGNICQIVAMSYYHMPYGISYPILQCAFIVGGLWGIFAFREVTDRVQIAVFFFGVAIVSAGVVLLGLFGPGAA